FAAFLLALAVGAVRRRGGEPEPERYVTGAAAVVAVAWLVQGSVDWLHLLPGVAAAALLCAAILVRPAAAGSATLRPTRPRRWMRFATVGVIVVAVGT